MHFLFLVLVTALTFNAQAVVNRSPDQVSLYLDMHTAPTLLVSCMDFRLIDDMVKFMNDQGFKDKYDHLIYAGSSLYIALDDKPEWKKTFFDHLDLAIKLHKTETVIFMDHRNCGAYKAHFKKDYVHNTNEENEIHTRHLHKARDEVKKKYPKLNVKTYILGLDSKIKEIT